jgi:outer membrane protein insertion porin family
MLVATSFVSFIFVFSSTAQYTGKCVESLEIQGNRRLTDEELLRYIKTRPGDKYDEARVQQDLQSLLKTGQFDPPTTRVVVQRGGRDGAFVIFEVRERPIVEEVHFSGLHYVSVQEIIAELRSRKTIIEINEAYNPVKVRKIGEIIRKYLAERGYADANVSISEDEVSATSVILKFQIDERPDVDEDDVGGGRR